ncbi:MAG: hypothetical protein EAZ97_07340 [Bacteroidetes bacterium]|nr:MAG: hypothetical protein EAZ97_07340 [Bacteroidota bacterium]
MKAIYNIFELLFSIPKNVSIKDQRFYSVSTTISLIGFFGHLSFLTLFYLLEIYFLAYVNIGSCALFLAAFWVNRFSYHRLSLFLSWLEAVLHSMICVYFIGWDSGFYFYFFAILIIIFLINFEKNQTGVVIVGVNAFILMALAYFEQFQSPQFVVPHETLKLLDMMNIGVTAFTLAFSTFYYRNAVKKYELEINNQKTDIEKKSKKITESINYARRIQYAILPSDQEINSFLPNFVVFYQPKDIVSGDFYWFNKVQFDGKTKIFVAVADCTGHGVPGAFMSLIGYNALNEVVSEMKIYEPAQILREVDNKFKNLLKQNETEKEINDGMDIALFSLENDQLCFSSAQRTLILIRNGEIQEIKGDKNPIGSYKKYPNKKFTDHQIILQENDCVYIYSDGITDQFSADNSKKYGSRQLKEFLLKLEKTPMNMQKKAIQTEIMNWKGDTNQTDDMLILGFEYKNFSK